MGSVAWTVCVLACCCFFPGSVHAKHGGTWHGTKLSLAVGGTVCKETAVIVGITKEKYSFTEGGVKKVYNYTSNAGGADNCDMLTNVDDADDFMYLKYAMINAEATLSDYPGEKSFGVQGTILVDATTAKLVISGTLSGLPADTTAGFHIHAGVSCATKDEVGGHWYSAGNGTVDPWLSGSTYTSDSSGSADLDVTMNAAQLGYNPVDSLTHAVVVHSADGTRIACGVLGNRNMNMAVNEGEDTEQCPLDAGKKCSLFGNTGRVTSYSITNSHHEKAGVAVLEGEFDDDDAKTLETLNITFSFFSAVGSAFIIFCYLKFSELKSFAFRLVFCMAIADIGRAFGNMLGDAGGSSTLAGGSESSLCQFQAVLKAYFGLASLLWSFAIAFTLHFAFLREDSRFAPANIGVHEKKYHAICWGVPCVVTFLVLVSGSFGDVGGWCWIVKTNTVDYFWRFTAFYLPLWVILGYSVFVYVKVQKKIEDAVPDSESSSLQSRIKYYPLVMVVCFAFASLNRVYEVFGGSGAMFISVLHVVFSASHGLANAIVYGLTRQVRERVAVWVPCLSSPEAGSEENEYNKRPNTSSKQLQRHTSASGGATGVAV